ncbi:ATP-dependent RNA helicase [Penicillium angulare]|uniref:ATP-dependent RNA helicase n=1 Tax=Penicillium angulare TaxID=116970 RepID=UPI002540143E|nr:ATP-dependent RNA helicase [Penicillium angulare]KAJ5259410.1 ATP-dependent RNA helicase [Penicillium angulare]
MLGVFRQFGVAQVLRASVPRTLSARGAPQLCKWQPPISRSPVLARSFQTSFPALNAASQEAAAATEDASESDLITKFADLQRHELVDGALIRNITSPVRMGLETMTDVQSQTINQMLQGTDVLAQAKTGTGKTLAFLLPTMQNIMSDPTLELSQSREQRRPTKAFSDDIRALIISPTRELAEQIAAEARKLTPGTGLMVQTAVGGTQKRRGLEMIQRNGCHLLVGTPGRIKDILSDPRSGVSAPKLNTLILDEADRLLDQGFAEEIQEIQALLPDPLTVDRQTLMFSATVPKGVMKMVNNTMKRDYKYVKTVGDDDVPVHLKVPQKIVFVRGYENRLPGLLELIKEYQGRQAQDPSLRPFKAIVYFNSTSEVQLAAEIFQNLPREQDGTRTRPSLGRMRLLEIHSRLTQQQRTYSADGFRKAAESILFSSDVTARGMDFPDVTHVIQMGVPNDRETYIHRTGRTARANKTGEAWIFIHDGEIQRMDDLLHGMPLQEDSETIRSAMVNMTRDDMRDVSPATREIIEHHNQAVASVSPKQKESAWRSQLGGVLRSINSKRTALHVLNNLALHGYGLPAAPSIGAALAKNLGISRYSDLINISEGSPRSPRSPFGRNSEDSGEFSSRRGGSSSRQSGSRDFRGGRSRDGGFSGSRSREGNSYGSRSRDGDSYGSRSRY